MKFFKPVIVAMVCLPAVSRAATNDFAVAASLLNAAKAGNVQQVQMLVSTGADINYVDNTGLSLVCTAIMNNDTRAAQILQMYGADASNCDRQIKDYKFRNVPERSSGVFGGLSKTQGLTLIGAGTAAVVGGLLLLTDVFDADNNNSGGGGSSDNNNNDDNNGGSTTDNGTALFTNGLPYGPATVNATGEAANYADNLKNWYSQTITGATDAVPNTPYYQNFLYMNANQNYLWLMRGYSPFARGYLGMRTLRNLDTNVPLTAYQQYELGSDKVMGGRPVNVALITANGVNAADDTSLQDRFLIWTSNSGTSTLNGASNSMISSKYYNNAISLGGNSNSIDDDTVSEDASLLGVFDWSDMGTAIHNVLASSYDNMLAKIVGGSDSGYAGPDFVGFMPNGQMTIYRTGGGHVLTDIESIDVGDYSFAGDSLASDDTFTDFLNDDWTVELDGISVTLTSTTDDTKTVKGYLLGDRMYLDTTGGDSWADSAFEFSNGNIVQVAGLGDGQTDYYNYRAMFDAAARKFDLSVTASDSQNVGRSKVDIIANLDVIEPLHLRDTATISDILSSGTDNYWSYFKTLVVNNYGVNSIDAESNLSNFFTNINQTSLRPPLLLFSTGASVQPNVAVSSNSVVYQDALQEATFENAAPLVFNNLEHLFMSVVAVGASTANVNSISANNDSMPSGAKYQLAAWHEGTGDDTTYYRARTCGIAGRGNSSLDPWCFAAVGITDEAATAAAAGAAGVLESAFYYMKPQQIFMLLALTADGPFLKTLSDGTNLTEDDLISRLSSMYDMPAQYQYRIDYGGENYLDVFKEVYGYGVINLERATKPTTNIYYYTGGKIVAAKNSYWRAAASTGLRSSGALNLGRAAVNLTAFDVLESIDGSMTLPRIWENNLELGGGDRHELYMGDVLADLQTRDVTPATETIGNFSFSLARSERAYNDNMNGIDNMRFEYANGNWKLGADYQHYLTDGASRFFDFSNPVLALASNAITSDVTYSFNNWHIGARAFSGAITDEGLLENDPAISANFAPMRLGNVFGTQSGAGWGNDKFGFDASVGTMRETGTVLGAVTSGLMEISESDTNYVDVATHWQPAQNIAFGLRATFAHTNPAISDGAVLRMSAMDSNAFAFDARVGRFDFGASLPLAVTRGGLEYDFADYEIVDNGNNNYGLAITDSGVRRLDLSAQKREVRFTATYKHPFGEFTDGALGLVYRVNPNNTDEFGNESIFMMKMTHRLGI